MSKNFHKSVVLSALEVAKVCGVVNQTAINWIKNGRLKAFKTPGGQFRVYPDDLVEFMNEREMRVPEELLDKCNLKNESNRQVKILFVDDDESFNNVSVALLRKNITGAEIFQAFDGFEAGSMAADKKPDCIILDLNLPGIDGIKICHTVKTSQVYGNPEVIVVTGMDDNENEIICRDLGVKHYFRKPVFIPELVTAVKDVLSIK